MIDKETIIELARLNGLRPWQQEKHYVQSLILSILSERMVAFKGGTYLWFFHNLRRFSEDLDFTAEGELGTDIDSETSNSLKLFGVENTVKRMSSDERSFSFRISAKGPLNTSDIDVCHVYVDVSRREKVVESTLPFRLEVDAYKIPVKIIRCMSLDEVAAEKVRALITRKPARDAYDLYFLIKNKEVRFRLPLVNEKLRDYDLDFSGEMLRKKLSERKSIWTQELRQLVFDDLPAFEEVEKTIIGWIE